MNWDVCIYSYSGGGLPAPADALIIGSQIIHSPIWSWQRRRSWPMTKTRTRRSVPSSRGEPHKGDECQAGVITTEFYHHFIVSSFILSK